MLRFESVSKKHNECHPFSYINFNGVLSPLSRKNLFELQDKIDVSSPEKYSAALCMM